jgi:hypothetical protein
MLDIFQYTVNPVLQKEKKKMKEGDNPHSKQPHRYDKSYDLKLLDKNQLHCI